MGRCHELSPIYVRLCDGMQKDDATKSSSFVPGDCNRICVPSTVYSQPHLEMQTSHSNFAFVLVDGSCLHEYTMSSSIASFAMVLHAYGPRLSPRLHVCGVCVRPDVQPTHLRVCGVCSDQMYSLHTYVYVVCVC